MDRWGDHALTCPCGGDRTIRHNWVPNVVFEEAVGAGLRPEREKAGLLPCRPAADGLPATAGARRPADVWLPRGPKGNAEAMDFAVTSGMQSALFRAVADDPMVVFERHEQQKRNYLQTYDQCRRAGFRFKPMVLEAHAGGWSGAFRGRMGWLARAGAAVHSASPAAEALRIAQRISSSLHRENARAVLRRLSAAETPTAPSGWAHSGAD